MVNTFRLDGDYNDVSTAYDKIRKKDPAMGVDTASRLNEPTHPQSITAIDIVTNRGIDEIRNMLGDLAVSVEEPSDEVHEDAMM